MFKSIIIACRKEIDNVPLSKIFGTRLRQARLNKGLNQSEVARLMGEAYLGNISMWELGKTFPGLEKVERLAELMGVKPCWFFTPDEDQAAATTFCEHYGPDLVTISPESWDPQPEPVNRHLKGFNFLEALCSLFVKRSFAF